MGAKDTVQEPLRKLSLSKEDLDSIDRDLVSALAVVSFAISEVNSLMRIHICSGEVEGDGEVKIAHFSQQQVILRAWSAKLYEFKEFTKLRDYNKSSNNDLKMLARRAQESFSEISAGDEGIAECIRNEVASHYSLKAARRNLDYVSQNADFSLYLHDTIGNSFYPMGEEVMFQGRMNRYYHSNSKQYDDGVLHKLWRQWNIRATSWAHSVHRSFINEIVIKNFPHKAFEEVNLEVSNSFVGKAGEFVIPIFFNSAES